MAKRSGFLAILALTFAALIFLVRPAAAQEPCSVNFPRDANPTSLTDEDVCNFHQVDRQVYRGGQPRPSAYPKLLQLGIRTVINLEEPGHAEQEREAIAQLNRTLKPEDQIDFISFPISQSQIGRTGVSDDQMRELFFRIEQARKPLFIHCYHGRDRTGAVIAIYRMLFDGMPYPEAFEEALHYLFRLEDSGLKRTIDRYRSDKKLKSLQTP